jgi:hypothetical protein
MWLQSSGRHRMTTLVILLPHHGMILCRGVATFRLVSLGNCFVLMDWQSVVGLVKALGLV